MIIKNRIPVSYILTELRTPLFYVCLIAIITGILPIYSQHFLTEIPINIATTLGVAISILLSYMINQSYERWWEARKIWGEIVNDSRTLVLQLKTYLDPKDYNIKDISHRQVAWNYCLGEVLRRQNPLKTAKTHLNPVDFAYIKNRENILLGILTIQSLNIKQLFADNALDRFSQIQIEDTFARLTASMGKCERIKNTVFPPIYRYGLHIAIYLFTIFLSLSVAFKLQHFVLEFLILVIISTVFFFLEKAAFRMQDPFENIPTDTPVTSIAAKIERDITELLNEPLSPAPKANKSFYTL